MVSRAYGGSNSADVQHISIGPPNRIVSLNLIPHSTLETKENNFSTAGLLLRPGIYKDVNIIVSELNNLFN